MAPITRIFANGIKAVSNTIGDSSSRRIITEIFDGSGKKIISRKKNLQNSLIFRNDLTTYYPGDLEKNSVLVSRNLTRGLLPKNMFLEEIAIKPPLTEKWGQTYLSNGAIFLNA